MQSHRMTDVSSAKAAMKSVHPSSLDHSHRIGGVRQASMSPSSPSYKRSGILLKDPPFKTHLCSAPTKGRRSRKALVAWRDDLDYSQQHLAIDRHHSKRSYEHSLGKYNETCAPLDWHRRFITLMIQESYSQFTNNPQRYIGQPIAVPFSCQCLNASIFSDTSNDLSDDSTAPISLSDVSHRREIQVKNGKPSDDSGLPCACISHAAGSSSPFYIAACKSSWNPPAMTPTSIRSACRK